MSQRLKPEFWKDGGWFVGRLPRVDGVFSQGETLEARESEDGAERCLEFEPCPVAAAV